MEITNQIFGAVTNGIKSSLSFVARSSSTVSESLDYNHITPTLLAVGRVNDERLVDLLRDLNDSKPMIWNLSDKALTPTARTLLYNQELDIGEENDKEYDVVCVVIICMCCRDSNDYQVEVLPSYSLVMKRM